MDTCASAVMALDANANLWHWTLGAFGADCLAQGTLLMSSRQPFAVPAQVPGQPGFPGLTAPTLGDIVPMPRVAAGRGTCLALEPMPGAMLLGIGQPDLYGAGSHGVLVHFCVPPMGLKGQLGSHHLASAKGKSERGDPGAAAPEDPISLVLSDG